MTFKDKLKSDLEVLNRVLKELQTNNAGQTSIAVVSGMIKAAEFFMEYEHD